MEVEAGRGDFLLNSDTRVVVTGLASAELTRLARAWRDLLAERTGLPLPMGGESGPGTIVIRVEEGAEEGLEQVPAGMGLPGVGAEGYELEVGRSEVVLRGKHPAGIFYGLETLSQLVTERSEGSGEGWAIPSVDMDDVPRFPYRGVHLDVGRHWFPVDFVKRYLDLLAAYKMNVFHWHLTEDQGWRIEIRNYPRLTEVGSCRAETILEKNFDPYVGDGIPYCAFYTQEEVREVVAYARDRFITVIPEIEMPGHSVAALAAYPELACTPGPFEVATRWGVTHDIYCPTEETFLFLENVLTEVMELFPGPYIHIGGDEAPKDRWEESEVAQEVIRREGLTNEDELQSWFIRRIETFLNEHGRSLVGWDEILEGGLAPNATVMSWRGITGGIAAAREGHDVIMSPTSHLYLDYYQGDTIQEPLAIGGFLPLEKVYSYEPIPAELSFEEALHILGPQGNVWTEYLKTPEQVEYMLLPRLLALSEVAWSPRGARDWEGFGRRLASHLERLDAVGANYRIPDVFGLESDRLSMDDRLRVELTAPAERGQIRFTLDGTDPTLASPSWEGPQEFLLDEGGVEVRARVIRPDGRMGAVRGARFRKATPTPPAYLPLEMRTQGLEMEVFPGTFSTVDSLPGEGGTVRSPAGPLLAPRVHLPEFLPAVGFGARVRGFIRVPRRGIYTFFLASDDGSRLLVDGETVVDNDGFHSMSEKRGQVALHRGWHPLEILYFQGGGGAGLSLEIDGPRLSRRPVPPAWLAHALSGGPS